MTSNRQHRKAFSNQIEKHQGIIHKITYLYTNTKADRQDLFQEICLQLWKSYASFREEAGFNTWMYRVALNTAINNIRKNKKGLVYEALKDNYIPQDPADDKEHVKLLYQSISKLNRIDKAIILLWLEEKNYEEIASIMGITKSNISVKLVRIKRKLEELINNRNKQHHGR